MGRPTKLTDHVIQTMEGQTQKIRERTRQRLEKVDDAEDAAVDAAVDYAGYMSGRPVVDAHAYVAELADCGRSSVEKWVTRGRNELAKEMRGRQLDKEARLFALFADAFDALRTASAQRIADPLVDTAMQTADKPNQIAAAKLVLPRIDPQNWGPQAVKLEVTTETQPSAAIEQLPQEAIDAMTPEQLETIETQAQVIAEAQAVIDGVIASLG